jgi:hypothetical protein
VKVYTLEMLVYDAATLEPIPARDGTSQVVLAPVEVVAEKQARTCERRTTL